MSVYLFPGVEIVLYIKDHNGNKFYFKLYCVILDELSVFTTLFCQIKRKKERKKDYIEDILGKLPHFYIHFSI